MSIIDRVLSWLGVEPEESAAGSMEASTGQPVHPPRRAAADSVGTATRRGRVVPMPVTASGTEAQAGAGRGRAHVVVCEPHSFDEVQSIAAHLRSERPVVVALKSTDRETARRIIDFLSGTVYALDGIMQVVSDEIILCAPGGVHVDREGLTPS